MLLLPAAALLLVPSALVAAAPAPTTPFSWKQISYIYGFGDSYTTNGWGPQNGVLTPSSHATFSGGPNWINYLESTFNKSNILLRDLAYGGATINSSLVYPGNTGIKSLADQASFTVGEFVQYFSPSPRGIKWSGKNSLFATWIGINDNFRSSFWTNTTNPAFHKTELDNWMALQIKLYNTGARNFLVLTVPPIDRTPYCIGGGAALQAQVNATVTDFNSQLYKYATAFKRSRSGVNLLWFDAHAAFGEILDNATAAGFKDTGGGCDVYNRPGTSANEYNSQQCQYPLPDYFWLNSFHSWRLNSSTIDFGGALRPGVPDRGQRLNGAPYNMLWLPLLSLIGSATAATVTLPLARRAIGPRSETFRESLSGANKTLSSKPLSNWTRARTARPQAVTLYSANASSTANATETTVGIQYGSSAVEGVLVSDVVKFGDFNSTQTFAATNRNLNFTTNALQSSLLGLGWASAAQTNATPYVEHLWRQGFLDEPLFALALSPSNGPDIQADVGFLTIGGTNSSQYTGEIQYIDRPPKVNLTFIIAGTAYPIHPDDFQLGGIEEDGVCVGAVLAFDDPDERWIIGVPFMYSYYSVFNFEKPGIGLAPMSRAVLRSDVPQKSSSSKSHWAVIGPVVAGIALLGVVAVAVGWLLWRRRGRIMSSRSKDIPMNTTTVQGLASTGARARWPMHGEQSYARVDSPDLHASTSVPPRV
ncbi:hypothetical protein RQP46_006788 [Phenoliferia psychrophenolica]